MPKHQVDRRLVSNYMSNLFIDELFDPPKIERGGRVINKAAGILGRKHGTVVSSGGWFAVIQWDGSPKQCREYIPDLEAEGS
jgi:hypothetical protein